VAILANAIPKSGTHLLTRLLGLLGLSRDGSVRFAPVSGDRFPESVLRYDSRGRYDFGNDDVPLGASTVRLISRDRFSEMVDQFSAKQPFEYCDAHLSWSEIAGELLANAKIKIILILRDPRAVAWSHVDWIISDKSSQLHKTLFAPLSLQDRLILEFFGLPKNLQKKWPPLIPLVTRYRNMAGWVNYPDLLVTTFEALVGEFGGGSAAEQARQIQAIAKFVNAEEFDLERIQDELWGASSTFRIGAVNSWSAQAHAFPDEINDQLAEIEQIVTLLTKRR
jgi:hypothetical protein